MSAQAGPGPSTMASSMVPTSAKLKVKKRVINLVNPADPQEFSAQSVSPSTSPNASHVEEEIHDMPSINSHTEFTQTYAYTPLNGVKGILRPTGTPGSGNGVRFFPKNRFRVITPNQALLPPTPKPPASPSNSFFSQLLAVTMPSMSPRRGPVQEEVKPDESWEQPGEEGEVSMVASTGSGDRTAEISEIEEREDSWNGEPEVHCSPLALPSASEGNTSNASFHEFELPSADLQLPEDMSNLLSTNFTTEDPSLSMADPPPALVPTRDLPQMTLSPIRETHDSMASEADFWGAPVREEISAVSEHSEHEMSNPTIRRHLAPTSTGQAHHPSTPTPVTRPFHATSIFADMSAEQAELTWPLCRPQVDDETDSNFPSPLRQTSPSSLATPRAGAGDITEFFDCTTMTLSPPDSSVVLRASSNHDFIVPTKALFEAQSAHTTALTTELELYRDLAKRLQTEVSERDDVLAKLNIRALEAEVLHSQVQDLREELDSLKSTRRTSLSPSSSPVIMQRKGSDLPSDRTMAAQSEAKDLEIRLAKALADAQDMTHRLGDAQQAEERAKAELRQVQAQMRSVEDEERDKLVQAEGKESELDALQEELDDAHRQLDLLERREREAGQSAEEIEELQHELEEARQHITELRSDAEEMNDLRAQLDDAHRQLEQLGGRDGDEQAIRLELEEAHRQLDENDAQIEELQTVRGELEEVRRQLDERDDEIEALRNELNDAAQPSGHAEDLERARAKILEMKQHISDLTQVKLADEEEIEKLLNQVDRLKDARKREDEWRARVAELERRVDIESHTRQEVEREMVKEKENRRVLEVESKELRKQLQSAREQLLESRSVPKNDHSSSAEVARLRSESASKDLEIVTLQRRKAELKEDREMLNIALDSKQQELELMKRKFAVRGIAGSTPLAPSRKLNHDASEFATPLPGAGSVKGMTTRRRSSLAQTPLPSVPKTLLQTPAPSGRHGVQLYPSTKITSRVMGKVDEENVPPLPVGSMRRRERMLA